MRCFQCFTIIVVPDQTPSAGNSTAYTVSCSYCGAKFRVQVEKIKEGDKGVTPKPRRS